MKKRVYSLILVITLLFTSIYTIPTTITAESNNTSLTATGPGIISSKDEVVYATLGATGKTRGIYVVNILDVSDAGAITDFGSYSSVKNMTDTAELSQNDNMININALQEGLFYYQGNMKASDLPWNIDITYSLDQKEITPEDLAGKNGHLQIHIQTTPNINVNRSFYDNYLLQITLSLAADKCTNIQTINGSLANAGKNKLITFTVMPGKEGNLTVNADVINFVMDGIDFAAIPFSMAIDFPDTSKITDELQPLVDAIQSLNEGTESLANGLSEMENGISSLKGGSASFQNGMKDINTKSSEIIGASLSIKKALNTIKTSLSKQTGGIDLSKITELPKGLLQLSDGLAKISDGISLLKENYDNALSALDQAMTGIPEYKFTDEEMQELITNNQGNPLVMQLIETYTAALTAKATYNAVSSGLVTVSNTLDNMKTSINTISSSLSSIVTEISSSLENMDITSSLTNLTQGISLLNDNYTSFHNGLIQYTDGLSQLSGAYNEIHSGISTFSDSMNELKDGTDQLHAGTNELYKNTNDMPVQIENEMNKLTADYDKSDYNPVSFVSSDNTKISSVQFVMKTEKIMKEETKDAIALENKHETFWTRLIALFKK